MHTHQQILLNALQLESAGVPIYVQLREQFLRAIGAGVLAPGDQMPTMRQVAVALKVDLNTVRHAYDELERAGAIRLERGRGSFVADAPPPRATALADPDTQTAQAENLARQAFALAQSQGVDPHELAQRIAALASPPKPSGKDPKP
jgi:GntR family transcriptional regulator